MSSLGSKLDIPSLGVIWIETCRFGNSTDTLASSASSGAGHHLFLSVVVWTVFNLVFQKLVYQHERLPPQPSALEFLFQVHVLRRALRSLVNRYGPVMRFTAWWCQDVIVLSSVATVEEFYKLHDAECGATPASMGRPSLSNAVAEFIYPQLNTYWHHLQLVLDMTSKDSDSGLNWALQALRRYPEVEHHIREELHRNCVDSKLPAIDALPYLQAVVKELFRLHPPCTVSFPRESPPEWCTMFGFEVRPRTLVVVNIEAVQRDPIMWVRPQDFDPVRFVARPEIEVAGNEFQMMPFGGGRGRCPGAKIALEHVQVGLARHYLQRLQVDITSQERSS